MIANICTNSDPQNAVDFVEAIYGDGAFLNSLYNALTDDGVLLTQVGETIYTGDIAETIPGNLNKQRNMYEEGLKNQGFAVVMNYEEAHAGFLGVWSFFAAFKNDSSRARWHMNEAQIDLEIKKRAVRKLGEEKIEIGEVRGLFDYFDGPTMATYRYPSKNMQVVYCYRDPKPHGCTTDVKDHYTRGIPLFEPHGFDPEKPNLGAENFDVNNSSGLVSRVTVPQNSYLMLEQTVHDVQVAPTTSEILQNSRNDVYDATSSPIKNFVSGDRDGLTIPRRVSTTASFACLDNNFCISAFLYFICVHSFFNLMISCFFSYFAIGRYSFHLPSRYGKALFPWSRMQRKLQYRKPTFLISNGRHGRP